MKPDYKVKHDGEMESAIGVNLVQESVANPFGGKGGGRSSTVPLVEENSSIVFEPILPPEESYNSTPKKSKHGFLKNSFS